MPLAFLFYKHGFEPRWGYEAEETHERFPAGPAKDAAPQ